MNRACSITLATAWGALLAFTILLLSGGTALAQPGGPGFAPARYLDQTAHETTGVVLADMNGDGALDMVVANKDWTNQIYFNDGAANFGDALDFGSKADTTTSLAVGDLNGDGWLDVVEGNSGSRNAVYFNDGSGRLSEANPFGLAWRTSSVAVGDLNGDGWLDIVVGHRKPSNTIYLNDGTGYFFDRLGSSYSFGSNRDARNVALGDLNGDTSLDIVVGNWGAPEEVYLNRGAAAGDFSWLGQPGALGSDQDNTWDVALGDVNGDGALDVMVANSGLRSVVYLNDPTGTGIFGSAHPFGEEGLQSASAALGDLNGDGALDVFIGTTMPREPNQVYWNDESGSGDFAREGAASVVDSTWAYSVALGDLNGDGALDAVCGNRFQPNTFYLNSAARDLFQMNLVSFFSAAMASTHSVALADMDRDGWLDVIAGNLPLDDGSIAGSGQDYVRLNDGTGRFDQLGAIRPFGSGDDATESLAVGDVNGDGALDIASGNSSGGSAVYWNDGAGHFDWPGTLHAFGAEGDETWSVALGDLNGDGWLDVVAGNLFQPNVI